MLKGETGSSEGVKHLDFRQTDVSHTLASTQRAPEIYTRATFMGPQFISKFCSPGISNHLLRAILTSNYVAVVVWDSLSYAGEHSGSFTAHSSVSLKAR